MIKSFSHWLAERLEVPNEVAATARTRAAMPQIIDFEAFIEAAKAEGVELRDRNYDATDLTASQKEFCEEKVKSMIEDGSWKRRPIVVSCDHFVIDGHHRWLAASQLGARIDCIELSMTRRETLNWLHGKPFVKNED